MEHLNNIRKFLLNERITDDNLEETCIMYNLIDLFVLPSIKLTLKSKAKTQNIVEKVGHYKEYCSIRTQLFDNIIEHVNKSDSFEII